MVCNSRQLSSLPWRETMQYIAIHLALHEGFILLNVLFVYTQANIIRVIVGCDGSLKRFIQESAVQGHVHLCCAHSLDEIQILCLYAA